MTGSGVAGGVRRIGFFSSLNVSPVLVSFNFATTAISPVPAKPMGFCFFPTMTKICPTRSLDPLVALYTVESGLSVPE